MIIIITHITIICIIYHYHDMMTMMTITMYIYIRYLIIL